MFNLFFRGVPVRAKSDEEDSYLSMITQLKEKVLDTGDAVGSTHWRSVRLFLFKCFY